jgi:hypothetical protein
MKTVWLTHDYEQAALKLEGKFADPSNANQVIDRDSTLISPVNGEIAAVLLRNVIPPALYLRAFELCKAVSDLVSNRAGAMGTLSLARSVNKDGVPSPRRGVNEIALDASPARQGILGWDRPGHETPLSVKHREMLNGNRQLIELMDKLYKQHLRSNYDIQRSAVEKVPWRLWNTAFTTMYVARNFQTAYHRDGNLPGAMTVITPTGIFSGGELALVRWAAVVPYKPGDLLIFDAEELHGNLEIRGERVSLALFCGRWIADCK